MLNYSQIKYFVKVAEYLNYRKAADNLCVSPTAVSKQVIAFESYLSEKLFYRNTRKVELTPFGITMLDKCKKLTQEVTNLEDFIESRQKIPQGQLTILVSKILARELILENLDHFIQKYPLIQCELIFSEQDNDLARNDIDIMVGFPQIPPLTDSLKYKRMQPISNILCGSPELIKKYGTPKSVKDLINYPFISHSLRKPATELPLKNGNYITCSSPVLFIDDFNALNQACKKGIGLFLTGDRLVEKDIKDGTLIQVLPEIKFKEYEIFTFYQTYGYEIPKIKAFLDFYL
ncbi:MULTISPECIES: LysR family transcriptional regulator [unclassified Francisella]|uniref:LysR family transcriptional regulator n=1 Tax=unclassified Francisella TaxID=2610885 RepID=UPI002E328B00|nr:MULTISPECIES: LysR family transcriptional regulator [unclassified Francisella]MED7819422.1 LysR family transcriptional regulator [Francisella sp. 19S2-4]MED7830211.1 LysR family transcriptional regulator [Francisella sp. 19S2-10]